MKNAVIISAIAITGIASSFGTYHLLENKFDKKMSEIELQAQQKSQNAQLVNNIHKVSAENAVDFTVAAESSLDAVVHVKTAFHVETRQHYFDPMRHFFYGNGNMEQRQLHPQEASGSGVIISSDGFIVTNNHVINKAEKIEVTLNNKKTYVAQLIGVDATTDLALLKIDKDNLPFVPYGNSDDVKVGEWVLAVGNPFNLNSTVTAGIISAKGRDINILEADKKRGLPAIESFIQTDAAVNPGNSGGALVASTGNLIGINTAIKSNTGSFTGYSFAIPVNIVRKVVDDLMEYGQVQRAFIGVTIQDLDEKLAEELKSEDLNGAYVNGLAEDGAAEEAGIEKGDVITKVGNIDVKNVTELQEQIGKFRPGQNVWVTVKRDNEEKQIQLQLKNKHGNTELVKKSVTEVETVLGANFIEVEDDERKNLKLKHGVKIDELNGGKLRAAGIKEGFIITKIDNKDITNLEELSAALNNKKGGILIEGIYPNGQSAYYGFGL